MSLPIPIPRCEINIRPAEIGDLAFIDSLQKMHSKQVGWMPFASLEQKIRSGQVLVARASRPCVADTGETPVLREEPAGYVIGCDQYFKRDDVGIIYQMNVAPGFQRGLVGASLLKAQFERSAYGCRLYCCWCAQDIEANKFWEAMGFVALAFRTGGRGKAKGQRQKAKGKWKMENGEEAMKDLTPDPSPLTPGSVTPSARTHIFWQKRIVADDTTTPWWFPAKTNAGSIREDRIVLPIRPGVHWSDEMPVVGTWQMENGKGKMENEELGRLLPGPKEKQRKIVKTRGATRGGLWFVGADQPRETVRESKAKVKVKCDPRLVAAARELRDRWLEKMNAEPELIEGGGKYEVNRRIEPAGAARMDTIRPVALLNAA